MCLTESDVTSSFSHRTSVFLLLFLRIKRICHNILNGKSMRFERAMKNAHSSHPDGIPYIWYRLLFFFFLVTLLSKDAQFIRCEYTHRQPFNVLMNCLFNVSDFIVNANHPNDYQIFKHFFLLIWHSSTVHPLYERSNGVNGVTSVQNKFAHQHFTISNHKIYIYSVDTGKSQNAHKL